MEIEDQNDDVCIGKVVILSDVKCRVDIIFNGARSIKQVFIELEFAAHIKEAIVYDEGLGFNVIHQEQIGEGGLKPFLDIVHEKYPNIQLIDHNIFDKMVVEQREAAIKLNIL